LVAAYRFDDPDGAMGIETHPVRTGDAQVLQLPLTYRGEPLPGADEFLVGVTEHSVLGRRWVYDGCGDAVYAAVLAIAILTGAREAEQWVEQADGGKERRESTAQVAGTGSPGAEVPPIGSVSTVDGADSTTMSAPGVELVVRRVLDEPVHLDADVEALTGTWPGSGAPGCSRTSSSRCGRPRRCLVDLE
jgi:hypothetical protein